MGHCSLSVSVLNNMNIANNTLRPVCTTIMHIQSAFKMVLSHPHYTHDFATEFECALDPIRI